MKKKPAQRYSDAWRAAVHAEAQAVLARVKIRDEAWRKARDETKAAQLIDPRAAVTAHHQPTKG
jgi:hypothetical protein